MNVIHHGAHESVAPTNLPLRMLLLAVAAPFASLGLLAVPLLLHSLL